MKSSKIKIGEVSPEQEDDVSDILETPPQQQQRKAKSTMVKMALLAPLCLINLIVFGAFSVLSPFFSKEVHKRACKFYVPRFVWKIVFDLPWIDWHQRCDSWAEPPRLHNRGPRMCWWQSATAHTRVQTFEESQKKIQSFLKRIFFGIWLKIKNKISEFPFSHIYNLHSSG